MNIREVKIQYPKFYYPVCRVVPPAGGQGKLDKGIHILGIDIVAPSSKQYRIESKEIFEC